MGIKIKELDQIDTVLECLFGIKHTCEDTPSGLINSMRDIIESIEQEKKIRDNEKCISDLIDETPMEVALELVRLSENSYNFSKASLYEIAQYLEIYCFAQERFGRFNNE